MKDLRSFLVIKIISYTRVRISDSKPLCLFQLLQSLGIPHIDSFNYMLEDGLLEGLKDGPPVYLALPNGDKVALWLEDTCIYQPTVPTGTIGVKSYKIYPTECRQRGSTYKGKIIVKLGWSINGKQQETLEKDLGEIPIMVKVNLDYNSLRMCRYFCLC